KAGQAQSLQEPYPRHWRRSQRITLQYQAPLTLLSHSPRDLIFASWQDCKDQTNGRLLKLASPASSIFCLNHPNTTGVPLQEKKK
ncbi:MAG: hypothetical protein L6R39_007692, partial [Caloplaca ligustica]